MEKWQPWPYLLDLIDIIQEYDLIYILKASQLGISWLMAIYNLWLAQFSETAKCLLLSQGQREAKDLLDKVDFIHSKLPDYLRLPTDTNNREAFSIQSNRAEIRAFPSVAKAGHGFQGTLVTRDELARHEYARDNFRAVARSGAKMVELSTANKLPNPNTQEDYFGEKTGEFYHDSNTVLTTYPSGVELYTNSNKPGQCMVFLKWQLRPVRLEGMTLQEWWESRVVSRYTPLEIEEQFPSCPEDVFRASKVRAYFDVQSLEDMEFQICPPIKQSEIDTYNSIIRVYKLPIAGRKYVCYTDPSDGVEDPFVTGIKDIGTDEVVASATGKVKADFCAKIHNYLVRAYNNATNSFEYTGSVGGVFSSTLNALGTPNQALRRKPDGKIEEGKRGQWVSMEYKKAILGYLAFNVVKRMIVVHDREFMQQAKLITRDDGGNPVTERNLAFDWVMMMAGLCFLSKFTPHSAGKMETVKYRRSG